MEVSGLQPIRILFVVLPTAILLLVGVAVKYFRAYWLISGYNTMSKEKKQNVDIEALANFTGNFCFVIAIIIGFSFLFMETGHYPLAITFLVSLFPLTIFVLIKTQAFDGNNRNPDGTMKRSAMLKIGFVIVFMVIVGIGVGVLLYQSYQPVEIVVAEEYFMIKGIYGEKIAYQDITEVALIQEIPPITARTNGSSLGVKKKGHFRMKELGAVKLFLDSGEPPFIYIERGMNEEQAESGEQQSQPAKKGKPVIINLVHKEDTESVYYDLYKAWKGE